ncbi:hypothetical protein [Streptomyces sp. SH5]|uniref:hypothetical protein n=1 Tax=Streptomyces sp. SH5 TaxID=3041765 RepID=UPI002477DE2C|nr:hypothetical protein [Streptomyces sp. SH5]WGP11852.1 hypothetical protein QFA72_20355 [Streptomyces sp. SH5]
MKPGLAIGYGALAGLCSTLGVALSLLIAGGPSLGVVVVGVLILATGPTVAALLFGRPAYRRDPLWATGQGLLSVLWQALWLAPFSVPVGAVLRSGSPWWPPLLLWLLNSCYCTFWAFHVNNEGGERPPRTKRHEPPTVRTGPPATPGPRSSPPPLPRSKQEERAITEFGELLAVHPFSPTLPGVDYVQVADHSLALDAYERAKRAPAGEVFDILAEGKAALAQLDARMGLDTVRSRTDCFFDPRHGPGLVSVQWAPRGGTPRTVQVCRADAVRLAEKRRRRRPR